MSISEKGPNLNIESAALEPGKVVEAGKELVQKLTPEEQIKNVDLQIENSRGQMSKLSEGILAGEEEMSQARQELGLPPAKEDMQHDKKRMEELQAQQKGLEQERARLEKERLIEEERQKILQEMVNELLNEFESFSDTDKSSVMASGLTSEGGRFGETSRGSLSPENAMDLARAFNEGIKMLPQILTAIPEIAKAFDEALTAEATQRVEENMLKNNEEPEAENQDEDRIETEKVQEDAEVSQGKGVPDGKTEGGTDNSQVDGIKAG